MILKSLKLENIRSYISQKIIFPEGKVLLSGDIGAGKSSILLAIEFALFGISRSYLSPNALLRNGAKKGSVELSFQLEDKEVTVKRALKRSNKDIKQDAGHVIINGVKREGTPVEIRSMIFDIIEYPKELLTKSKDIIYRYTVYTPQEEMKQILIENKDERLDTLRKVFGIDKYKSIRENAGLFTRHIKERCIGYQGELLDLEEKKRLKKEREQENEILRQELKGINVKIDYIKAKIHEKKSSIIGLEAGLSALNRLRTKLEVKNTELRNKLELRKKNTWDIKLLDEEISGTNKKIAQMRVETIDLSEAELEKNILDKEKEYHSLLESQSALKQKIAAIISKLEHTEQWLRSNSKKLEALHKKEEKFNNIKLQITDKQDIKKKITSTEKFLEHINNTIQKFEANKNSSEDIRNKLSRISNCPVCLQEVSKEHKHQVIKIESDKIGAYLKKIKEHHNTKQVSVRELEKLKIYFDDLIEKEKEFETLKVELHNLNEIKGELIAKEKDLVELSHEKKEMESRLVDKQEFNLIRKELDGKKILLKRLRDNELIFKEKIHLNKMLEEKTRLRSSLQGMQDNLKKDIGDINSQKIGLASEMRKFESVEKESEKCRTEFEELLTKERHLELKQIGFKKELENVDSRISELNIEIEKKLETKKRLQALNELEHWLEEYFIKLMYTMEKTVMLKVYNEFNDLFKDWFNMLIEDGTLSIRLDEEFTPIVEQNGYDISVANLSGGERTACALAYRLALNKVINDVMSRIKTRDIIILDEPTDGFSAEQLDKVRDVLDLLPVRQIIIVSHESKIESFVDHVIRIEKMEHISGAVG